MARSGRSDQSAAVDGRATAVTAREHRAQLLAALFRHYDRDEEFKGTLLELIPLAKAAVEAHGPAPERSRIDLVWFGDPDRDMTRPGVPEGAAFLAAARDLVAASGLGRLGEEGLLHVLAWCDRYVSAERSSLAPSAYGPGTLSTVRYDYTFEPEVYGIVPPPWKSEEWSPTREPRSEARKRLEARARRAIQRALDDIERETAERDLLSHPRHIHHLERDVAWLYTKLRFGTSYQDIYNNLKPPPEGVETVRKAVERVAKRLGVETGGWESGWR
jgi:hypothetical protein